MRAKSPNPAQNRTRQRKSCELYPLLATISFSSYQLLATFSISLCPLSTCNLSCVLANFSISLYPLLATFHLLLATFSLPAACNLSFVACNLFYFSRPVNYLQSFSRCVQHFFFSFLATAGFEPATFRYVDRCSNHYTPQPIENLRCAIGILPSRCCM